MYYYMLYPSLRRDACTRSISYTQYHRLQEHATTPLADTPSACAGVSCRCGDAISYSVSLCVHSYALCQHGVHDVGM